jgi:integrase/recombinase XerD
MSMLGSFQQAVQGFLLDRRISGLTPATLATYKVHLDIFERWCQGNGISFQDLTTSHIRSFLAERQTKSQMRLVESYRRLRPFFRWAAQEEICNDLFATIRKPREPKPLVHALTVDQVKALIGATRGRGAIGERDEALIRLLVDTGLRISEALSLRLEEVNLADGRINVRRGKGQKDRIVYIGVKTVRALTRYLRKGDDRSTGLLFLSRDDTPVTRRHAHQHMARLATKSGIENIRLSPHTLRHTFATLYLKSGGDLFSLQRQLGHTSILMTKRYLDLTEGDVAHCHALHSPGDLM